MNRDIHGNDSIRDTPDCNNSLCAYYPGRRTWPVCKCCRLSGNIAAEPLLHAPFIGQEPWDFATGHYKCRCCECGKRFMDANKRAVACPRCIETKRLNYAKMKPAKPSLLRRVCHRVWRWLIERDVI